MAKILSAEQRIIYHRTYRSGYRDNDAANCRRALKKSAERRGYLLGIWLGI